MSKELAVQQLEEALGRFELRDPEQTNKKKAYRVMFDLRLAIARAFPDTDLPSTQFQDDWHALVCAADAPEPARPALVLKEHVRSLVDAAKRGEDFPLPLPPLAQADRYYANHSVGYVRANFPELIPYIPDKAVPFHAPRARYFGCCTHPERALASWLDGEFCRSDNVPDGFCAVGTREGASEFLVAAWRTGNRRFFFLDCYVFLFGDRGESVDHTGQKLREALAAWERGESVEVNDPFSH